MILALIGFACASSAMRSDLPSGSPDAQAPVYRAPCWICLGTARNTVDPREPCFYCNGRGYELREAP